MNTPLSTRLATCFGVGHVPWAPGTAASLVALPFAWALGSLNWYVLAVAIGVVTLLGIWACGSHAKAAGLVDPSECVIDEVAGQWLALIPVAIVRTGAFGWRPFVMAFFLFRLFDMLKPWPVSAAEHLPGGFGIMADDITAGAIAAALLYVMLFIGLV